MLCKPSALEQELAGPVRTLQDWLQNRVPHHRDNRGHLWNKSHDLPDWMQQLLSIRRCQRWQVWDTGETTNGRELETTLGE